MNSTIASNIIGNLSLNQKVASGSCSSALVSHIEFAVTDKKCSYTASNNHDSYLWKLGGKESPDTVIVPNKFKNNFDQNKNSLVNPYVLQNGNKEKVVDEGIPTPKVQLYAGKIYMEWKQVYKIGAGLNNLGNTCFMNTVIQCLTYCPPLANYLLHESDHLTKCSVTGFCMMCVMQKHMKRVIGKSGQVIKPIDVYQKLRSIAKHFQFGRQEDAHEFLRYVIDNLWKSCLANYSGSSKLDPASKETTIINQIFGGYHRSQVTCLRCTGKSNTFDHFMDFILDIKQNVLTLEKALEKFTHPELLQLENAYRCPKCKMKVSAQKKFSVYQAPNVATFQLKRFDYHRAFGGKITKQVTYPEKLNLRPYMSDTRGDPVLYRLNAVLVHSGSSCNSGHYYCYVKNSNGYWYLMDDQRVHQVSINQVLSESAYVLFYIRLGSSDGNSSKKCIDNKSQLNKIGISVLNNKRDIVTLKSSPLRENVQAVLTNSTKSQSNSLNILNKKTYTPLTQNRERVSFDIRPKASIVKEIESQNSPSIPSPMETKHLISVAQPKKTHSGLVPYCEDSSDSSSEEEVPALVAAKVSQVESKKEKVISFNSSKNHIAKQTFENGKDNVNSPISNSNFEIKARVSPSVFHLNKSLHNNSINSSVSASHKVKATAVWNVTDINLLSPSVGSGSSSTSVNSTTDWNVTTGSNDRSVKKAHEKNSELGTVGKSTSEIFKVDTHLLNNNVAKIHSKVDVTYLPVNSEDKKKQYPSYSDNKRDKKDSSPEIIDSTSTLSSADDDVKSGNEKSSVPSTRGTPCVVNRSQNSDFRKCKEKDEQSFLENGSSKPEKLSFLKRTFSDANKISESPTQLHGDCESRHSPVSKKAKVALEKSMALEHKDKSNSFNKDLIEKSSENGYKKTLKSRDFKQISLKETKHQNGTIDPICERTSNKNGQIKIVDIECENSQQSTSSSSSSSVEYEWVEKTKETIEKDIKVYSQEKSKDFNKSKTTPNQSWKNADKESVVSELNKNSKFFYRTPEKSKDYTNSKTTPLDQSWKNLNKESVVSELNKNSKFFYGAPVESWTGEKHVVQPTSFDNRKKYFNYDDDIDRGKVRKHKTNYRYHNPYRGNPFQNRQNEDFGHSKKFYDKSRHSNYGHRNFNSNHKWKPHWNNSYSNDRRNYKSYSNR